MIYYNIIIHVFTKISLFFNLFIITKLFSFLIRLELNLIKILSKFNLKYYRKYCLTFLTFQNFIFHMLKKF